MAIKQFIWQRPAGIEDIDIYNALLKSGIVESEISEIKITPDLVGISLISDRGSNDPSISWTMLQSCYSNDEAYPIWDALLPPQEVLSLKALAEIEAASIETLKEASMEIVPEIAPSVKVTL